MPTSPESKPRPKSAIEPSETRAAAPGARDNESFALSLAEKFAEKRRTATTKKDAEELLELLSAIERLYAAKGESASAKEAKEILGSENVFGPESVERVFGFLPEKIPDVPFTKEQLEEAKRFGEMLVLRLEQDKAGKPLTMKRMNEFFLSDEHTKKAFTGTGQKTLMLDTAWYKDEKFFTEEHPRLGWALVGRDVSPDTTDRNYVEQTRKIRDSLASRSLLSTDDYEATSDAVLAEITKIMATNPKAAAEQLIALLVNVKFRRRAVDTLYDLMVTLGTDKKHRLLQKKYEWTASRSSDGYLVYVGGFDADGASVRRQGPGLPNSSVGVSLSRSQ